MLNIRNNIPNIISASRGITAIIMLFFPVFSTPFWVLYGWCGLSDMIDGPLARKMNAESGLGSKIDSLADLIFVICSCILILPSIDLPVWLWLWVASIGIAKTVAIPMITRRQCRWAIPHSRMNKLTGFLLFCLPFTLRWLNPVIPSILVCAAASFSVFADLKAE